MLHFEVGCSERLLNPQSPATDLIITAGWHMHFRHDSTIDETAPAYVFIVRSIIPLLNTF